MKARDENRKNFIDTRKMLWKNHKAYLQRQQQNPNFCVWIILYHNRRAGFVKLNGSDLSTVLLKRYQGCRLGTKALSMAVTLCRRRGIKYLDGRIKVNNTASRALYRNNGYAETMVYIERNI